MQLHLLDFPRQFIQLLAHVGTRHAHLFVVNIRFDFSSELNMLTSILNVMDLLKINNKDRWNQKAKKN